jgi:hypothetical protein
MAQKFAKPKKEKKKPKKNFGTSNGKITTKRAMYDNQFIGIGNTPLNSGY